MIAQDFIIFLGVDWDTHGTRNRQHFLIREIARQIEGKGQVLAMERPVCPVTGPFRRTAKFMNWLRGRRGLRQERPNLHIYTPFVLLHNVPAASIPGLTPANRYVLGREANRVMDRLAFRREVLVAWIHHPYQLEDVRLVGERLLVYDCYDDYFSGANTCQIPGLKRREEAILASADVVLVASERLLQAMRDRAPNVQLVPNGADLDLLARVVHPETRVPPEMAALTHHVVGFVGRVTRRLDFELLAHLAVQHPGWTFALVGPTEDEKELGSDPAYARFSSASNVYFLGAKPYESLPAYLKAFDVCIIPYDQDDPFNTQSSPLKLYEYLATGKPIVTTDLPALGSFDSLVRIARNAQEFERHIAEALQERDPTLPERRLEAARENSWKRRAEEILQIIDTELASKPA